MAILVISLQHALSVLGYEELTRFYGLSLGQFGVSIFCVLSGFLAFKSSQSANVWIKRRLWSIFPAYWIAMLVSFALAWISGYKMFDRYQFFSQMLGLGFFTHGWNLVNVASWFISLLLLCYGLAYLAKLSSIPMLMMGCFLFIAIGLVCFRIHISISRHLVSFCCAAIGGILYQRFKSGILLFCVIPLFLLSVAFQQFAYAAGSLGVLALSVIFPNVKIWGIRKMTSYIYEYFLIHGILFVGVLKFSAQNAPIPGVFIAVFLSCAAAWMLKYVALQLSHGVVSIIQGDRDSFVNT